MAFWDFVGELRTGLHLDWADAVNVAWRVVWADDDTADADEVISEWYCFSPRAIPELERFLEGKDLKLSGESAVILSFEQFEELRCTLPRCLAADVVKLEQRSGWVVRMPAGWMHQLSAGA
jgi:hypothetical protein